MTTLRITLPDQLAQEARRAGLLSPERLEPWLRDQLKGQRVDELFLAMDRMAGVDSPAEMSPADVAHKIAIMRAERRAQPARIERLVRLVLDPDDVVVISTGLTTNLLAVAEYHQPLRAADWPPRNLCVRRTGAALQSLLRCAASNLTKDS